MAHLAQACITRSVYFQQTAVYSQRRGHFNRAKFVVRATDEKEAANSDLSTTRRGITGSAIGLFGLLTAKQASAGFSPTKSDSKEKASKERAARMKEKVAKAKQSGGFVQ